MQLGFMLYDDRSGSTLLAALLNRYRQVHVSQESAYVSRTIEYAKPVKTEQDLVTFVDYLYEEVLFRELGFDKTVLLAELQRSGDFSKRGLIDSLVRYQLAGRDESVCIVKHSAVEYLDDLSREYPGIKYVHIVRDGRGVYKSKRSTRNVYGKMMSRSCVHAAKKWVRHLRIVDSHRLGEQKITIRYEDLITDQENVIAKILAFLGVDSSGVSKTVDDYRKGIGDRQHDLHVNLAKGAITDNVDNWKTLVPKRELIAYEYVAKEQLKHFGYPLTTRSRFFPMTAAAVAFEYARYCLTMVQNIYTSLFVDKKFLAKLRKRLFTALPIKHIRA